MTFRRIHRVDFGNVNSMALRIKGTMLHFEQSPKKVQIQILKLNWTMYLTFIPKGLFENGFLNEIYIWSRISYLRFQNIMSNHIQGRWTSIFFITSLHLNDFSGENLRLERLALHSRWRLWRCGRSCSCNCRAVWQLHVWQIMLPDHSDTNLAHVNTAAVINSASYNDILVSIWWYPAISQKGTKISTYFSFL